MPTSFANVAERSGSWLAAPFAWLVCLAGGGLQLSEVAGMSSRPV
jgi:hypothetical protein